MEMVKDDRETMAGGRVTNWKMSRCGYSSALTGRCHLGPAPLLAAVFLLLLAAPGHAAEFTRTFSGLTKAADLALGWDGVDARYMPLTIHAVVVNRTGNENRANVFRRNLAVGINGTSWVWKNMPSPLPYLATGQYQVEIRTETQANATAGSVPPVLPKSPYFSILEVKSTQPTGSPGGATSPSPASDGGGRPSSKTISLAAGIVVTLVILLLAGTGCLCWRRRYMRAKSAKKRENKFDVVIH
ncbi:hypothetical protein RB595_002311 [Gaeumannomyces hyphopodioides]